MIKSTRVTLRPLEASDLKWVRKAAQDSTIIEWWDHGDGVDYWDNELLDDPDVIPLIIEVEGNSIGYIEYEEESDEGTNAVYIDMFIGREHQSKGYGKEAMRALIQWLFEEKGHHRIEIEPAASNKRAIAMYKSIGFAPIGISHQRQRTSDGSWGDSLLMELLKDNLNEF